MCIRDRGKAIPVPTSEWSGRDNVCRGDLWALGRANGAAAQNLRGRPSVEMSDEATRQESLSDDGARSYEQS
eukprot:1208151-Karenia_brevis.AAC.1